MHRLAVVPPEMRVARSSAFPGRPSPFAAMQVPSTTRQSRLEHLHRGPLGCTELSTPRCGIMKMESFARVVNPSGSKASISIIAVWCIPRSVTEHASGGDEQVELHAVHDARSADLLAEDVTHGSLLLHALECGRELLVLLVGEPQRLSRATACSKTSASVALRNGRRADHLVLDPVPKLPFVHVEMDPAKHRSPCRPRRRRSRWSSSSRDSR